MLSGLFCTARFQVASGRICLTMTTDACLVVFLVALFGLRELSPGCVIS
jgi:hypothetical protein